MSPEKRQYRPFSAQQILERMLRRYARCQTYRDVGSVIISSGKAQETERKANFETVFARANTLRFECNFVPPTDEHSWKMWSDGSAIHAESHTQKLSYNDLTEALASIAFDPLPAPLLFSLPLIESKLEHCSPFSLVVLSKLVNFRMLPNEESDEGAECFVLTAPLVNMRGTELRLCVSASNFELRRLRWQLMSEEAGEQVQTELVAMEKHKADQLGRVFVEPTGQRGGTQFSEYNFRQVNFDESVQIRHSRPVD